MKVGSIEAEAFFDKYIRNQNSMEDKHKYSFLVGYYFHLIADIEWSKMHKEKKNIFHSQKSLKRILHLFGLLKKIGMVLILNI